MAKLPAHVRLAQTYRLAWLPIPKGEPYAFAYAGLGADRAAKLLSAAIRTVVLDTQALADRIWRDVTRALLDNPKTLKQAVELASQEMLSATRNYWMHLATLIRKNKDLEQDPLETRVAVTLPLEQMYRQLADKLDAYASGDLRKLYLSLSAKVDVYFSKA